MPLDPPSLLHLPLSPSSSPNIHNISYTAISIKSYSHYKHYSFTQILTAQAPAAAAVLHSRYHQQGCCCCCILLFTVLHHHHLLLAHLLGAIFANPQNHFSQEEQYSAAQYCLDQYCVLGSTSLRSQVLASRFSHGGIHEPHSAADIRSCTLEYLKQDSFLC